MTHTPRRLVRIAATTLCAAVPASAGLAAQASAATITVDKACYVIPDPVRDIGPPMTVTGSGFGAGDPVDISGGTTFDSVTADANGNFVAQTPAPTLGTLGPGTKTTTLTATDERNSALTASLPIMSANLSISTSPGGVRNVHKDKVTFRFSGFTPGQRIVGYYLWHKKLVAHSVFGRATGPCGTLSRRTLLYPGGRPPKQVYKVTFESVMHYSKTAIPRVTGTLDLYHF